MRAIITNFGQTKFGKGVFIDCVKELRKRQNTNWVNILWIKKDILTDSFNKNDWLVIIDSLLLIPNINYDIEDLLSIAAKKYPGEIISFFRERVILKAKKKSEERYDAIPFSFYNLNKPLSENTNIVIKEILKWFEKGEWLFYWEGGHLLQLIFPAFNDILEKRLKELLKSKKKNKAKIVLYILRSYEGETSLHNMCKEFIKMYPKSKKYQTEMFIVLSKTGVVSGEYGFVEAYKRKLNEIQSWESDKSKAVKEFVKQYEIYLKKQIVSSKKRADEEIETRKREFNN